MFYTWGLTTFDGKNSGEPRSIACLRAINSEEARASVPRRLRLLWLLRDKDQFVNNYCLIMKRDSRNGER